MQKQSLIISWVFSHTSTHILYQRHNSNKKKKTRQQIIKCPYNLYCWLVKEKGESKPRQHTIDLSQMAVPIQVAQEKKPSPESPKPSTSEAEPSAEYITAGNGALGSLKKPTSYRYQALLEDEFPLGKKTTQKKQNCN